MNVIDMLPSMVQRLLKCEHDRDLRVLRNLDIVDLFAGKARVARWGELLNLRVAALDREFGQHFDICTDLGLANTLCTILRVRESGMCMMGPQCSSWVWLSRSVSKRSPGNPYGDCAVETVREGNQVNERVALICVICSMLGIKWLVEQPGSSLFFHTQLMGMVVAKENAFQRHFFMKDFGHTSSKPTLLIGVADFLSTLGKAFKRKEPKRRRKPTEPKKQTCEKKPRGSGKSARQKKAKATNQTSGAKVGAKPKTKAQKPRVSKSSSDQDTQLCTVNFNPATGKKAVTGKRDKAT